MLTSNIDQSAYSLGTSNKEDFDVADNSSLFAYIEDAYDEANDNKSDSLEDAPMRSVSRGNTLQEKIEMRKNRLKG